MKDLFSSIMRKGKRKTRSLKVVRCLRCGKILDKDGSKNQGYGDSCLRKKNEEQGRPTVF
jgi:hypothetical protein